MPGADDIATLQIRVLTDQVDTATRRLDRLETQSRKTERAADDLGGAVKKAGELGNAALGALGIGAVGLAASIGTATQAWLKYDKAMKQVNSIAGLQRKEFGALRQEILKVSAAVGVDAAAAAEGLFEAISADIPKENAVDFLTTASKTAVGGITDVGTAVNALTNVMNAYKLPATEAEAISDKLFATVLYGKATFEELGASMAKTTVPAAAVGVEFDEILAMLIAITKQGTSATEGFTQITGAIQSVLNPSKEMKAVYDALGVASGRQAIAQFGLAGTLEEVRKAYANNDAALIRALRTDTALAAQMATTGRNLKNVKDGLDAVASSAGSTEKAFRTNAQTLEIALNSVKSSTIALIEQMEASFGVITKFGEALQGVAGLINSLAGGGISGATETVLGSGRGVLAAAEIPERIKELEQLKTTLESARDAGDWLTGVGEANGGFGDGSIWTSGRRTVSGSLESVNAELDKLKAAYGEIDVRTKAIGSTMSEINRTAMSTTMSEEEKKSWIEQQKLFLDQKLAGLDEEKKKLDAIAASEKAANEAEVKDREAKMKLVKEQEKAVKEEKKALDEATRTAQELATTDRDRLELKRSMIEAALAAGTIDQATSTKALAALEQEIALLEERNLKKAGGGAGGAAGYTPGLGAMERSLTDLENPWEGDSLFDRLEQDEQAVRESYERRKDDILRLTEATESEKLQLLKQSEEQFQIIMEKGAEARQKAYVESLGNFFGDIETIASAFGKKGAKIAKAAAIAKATVDMYSSAVGAYNSLVGTPYVGPYIAPVAAAAALAAGAANIAKIKGTDYSGEYAHGGLIPSGKYGVVGEAGPEFVQGPAVVTSARTTAALSATAPQQQAPPVQVFVTNNAPGVEFQQQTSPDGRTIEIIADRVEKKIARGIDTGHSPVARSVERNYPVTRGRR